MFGRREPAPGLMRRLDALARAAMPTVIAAVLMMLAAAPVGVPSGVPAVALPCVFFWSVFRPAAMPPPAVFGLGLLQDLLTFAPLGVGVFILLLVHGLALSWRRHLARQSFLVVWLAFSGFAAMAAGLGFALQALLGWVLPPIAPALHLLGLTMGIYPLLSFLLTRTHGAIRAAEEVA
ncbi:rod shape-determining protein MreD [Humitalea rosea]|uniref:Rod shape-determining protein MreD n=2 Tax=Humitalea rosea TaxID=990373 RepID=A0A2W7JFX5_9PROT|nr:rod shape-determining protein MreD [Humitalea rosea]